MIPTTDQLRDLKARSGDAATLLLFRVSDFYELYDGDAQTAAKTLGLTLASRGGRNGTPVIPMAGFPYHQLEAYLAKLLASGYRAAVCEQVK